MAESGVIGQHWQWKRIRDCDDSASHPIPRLAKVAGGLGEGRQNGGTIEVIMPFTPFHFGPSTCISLLLKRHIDFPIFVLANVVVDFEPLTVILLGLRYPLHGYFHTFIIGALVGIVWGLVAYAGRGIFKRLMNLFRLSYATSLTKMLVSGILGVWFHVLLDALIYTDIRPFYPLAANPLYGLVSISALYRICAISFIPALILYVLAARSFVRKNKAAI